MAHFVYDIETYPNIFTMIVSDTRARKYKTFEISEWQNDFQRITDMFGWLSDYHHQMVGFNNVGFDYPVLHRLMKDCNLNSPVASINKTIYDKAQQIIDTPWDDRFDNVIWPSAMIVPQIDLFKIHHFDNVSRSTSLKTLEFNMRMKSIEDLPYAPGTYLNYEQSRELIEYNKHDVTATLDFYDETLPMIKFRETMTKAYGVDMTNFNDAKMGEAILVNRLEEDIGEHVCYFFKDGRKRPRQSPRKAIALADVVLPSIKFESVEFNAILDWFNAQVITQTKGVFSEIPFDKVESLEWVSDMAPKNKKMKELNVILDGFKFVFGTGGIHGSIDACTVVADDYYEIVDADVISLYPRLAIVNSLYPEHLTESFIPIYDGIFNERASHAKGTLGNAALKLALNGAYGKSNSKYSPLYDPKYTMATTINGQLQLCMLAERLMQIDDLTIIQINTDGVTVKLPKCARPQYDQICKQWEKETMLDLEYAQYSRMFIRNVNNYIGEYTDGKIKRKGAAFIHERKQAEVAWHKNHSHLVIQKAVEARLIHGTDIREFIEGHDDMYDFMLRTKVPRASSLIGEDYMGRQHRLQNITRYFISKGGLALTKVMPPLGIDRITTAKMKRKVISLAKDRAYAGMPIKFIEAAAREELEASHSLIRYSSVNKGCLVTEMNKMRHFDRDAIDYDWYVARAEETIYGIVNTVI